MSPITLILLIGCTLLGLASHAIAAPSSNSFCQPRVVTPLEQDQIFRDFVDLFYVKKDISAAYHRYFVADYIQHNPFVLSGPQPSIDFLGPRWPKASIEVRHVSSVEANVGWIHFRGLGSDFFPVVTAVVDIVRMNGSCVAEHWDVIQGLPANATNPLALF